jgi:hypothetical protein
MARMHREREQKARRQKAGTQFERVVSDLVR